MSVSAVILRNIVQRSSFLMCGGHQLKRNFAVSYAAANSAKKFSKQHEWISVQGNVGTVGITDYAQDKLGEVVYIELPSDGAKFDQEGQFATLESVKAVSECYMPVGGTVKEVNKALAENPSLINKAPFDAGWLVKIDLSDKSQVDKLLTEEQYKEFLKSDEGH